MSKEPLPGWFRRLMWYAIALMVCLFTWMCIEGAFCETIEHRPWDPFVCLCCAYAARLFAEYITRER